MNTDMLERKDWKGGQLLAFSGLDGFTDFNQALTARTAFDAPGIDVMLPARCRVRFPVPADADNTVAGDWFCAGGRRGAFLDTFHLLIEGPCTVAAAEPGISVAVDSNRTLIGAASHFNASRVNDDIDAALSARSRWIDALRLPAGLSQSAARTLIKALSVMKTQVYTPEGRIRHRWTTPDRWPHRQMWLWDSAFHAIGWRHVDPELARDAVSAVLDMQAPDGFVAHMMNPTGTSGITQPPVLAMAAKLVHDVAPDGEWIAGIYPKLCAYVEWDLAHRYKDGSGLVEWKIDGDPLCRSGESGMDNSPRFDSATLMDAVDFNSFLALECEILAGFAASLDRVSDAVKWEERHAGLCRLIADRLWSGKEGFFVDYDIERKEQSAVLASSGFLPLICGAASRAQAGRLAECLADPAMFGTAFPVPSIAAKDVEHYSKDMWRGPVWINLNWLIMRGFERYGMKDVAAALRARTMQGIEAGFGQHRVLFEFFDDRGEVDPPRLLRKGQCAPEQSPMHQVFHDYGWTATLYADLAYTSTERK